jgi:hypothetical protein
MEETWRENSGYNEATLSEHSGRTLVQRLAVTCKLLVYRNCTPHQRAPHPLILRGTHTVRVDAGFKQWVGA